MPTKAQQFSFKSDSERKAFKAQQALMVARVRRGCISEDFKHAAQVSAVGTPEQVQALRVKWGIE